MEQVCAQIADVSLRLKRQYQVLLGISSEYGVHKQTTKEMDSLGLLIKELEDGVIVLQIKLEARRRRNLKRPAEASLSAP